MHISCMLILRELGVGASNGKTGHKGKDDFIMSNSGQKLWSAVWNLVCAYTLTH